MPKLDRPMTARLDPAAPSTPVARAAHGVPRARRVLAGVLAGLLAASTPAGWTGEAGRLPSTLPSLGDTSSNELSPAAERRMGEEIMRQIRAASDDLEDPETNEYLNQFAAQLASHVPADAPAFELFVVKDPTINAFALPGGFIGLHTGLLVAAQSESELAGVIGHEMGHVTQRHIARSIENQRDSSLVGLAAFALTLLAARSGNSQLGQAAMASGMAYSIQSQLGFSREAEREADRVGLQFLGDGGFDVNGMVDFFGRMQQASRFYESAAPVYLRTHPLTTERIGDIRNRIRDARYRQRADSPDFQLIRARMRVLQDDSGQGLREARQFFEDQIRNGQSALQPGARYGLALALARLRDLAGARRELGLAQSLARARSPVLEKFSIELAGLTGDKAGAVELARAARTQFPQSRMIAVAYAETLQQAERHDEALAFLRDQASLYRGEAKLQDLLARSYAARGNEVLSHKALAESYFLRGNLRAALNQLQLARRGGSSDFYELSQIDARTRQIQSLILERERANKESGKR